MGYVTGFTTRKKKQTKAQEEREKALRLASKSDRVTSASSSGRPKRKQDIDELSQDHRKRVKHKSRSVHTK